MWNIFSNSACPMLQVKKISSHVTICSKFGKWWHIAFINSIFLWFSPNFCKCHQKNLTQKHFQGWLVKSNWKLYFLLEKKLNPLRVNPTKWSNKLKQFVGYWSQQIVWLCLTNQFVGLLLKGLRESVASFRSLIHFLTELLQKTVF